MTTIDNTRRARLSKAINRIADNMNEIRNIAIELLQEQTEEQTIPVAEEMPLIGKELDVCYLIDDEPVKAENIKPMQKNYALLLTPPRQSRWASVGQVSIYDMCKAMRDEFPSICTKAVTPVCKELGIEIYTHGHSTYINYQLADVIADYFRRNGHGR